MKKYKLIQIFPASDLTLGTIVTQDELGQYVTKSLSIFKKEDVESFPTFWKEIIEEIYEIVGFNDGFNDYYKTLDGKFTINGTRFYDENYLIDNFEITVINRKSDNKIFRIGDKIVWDWIESARDFYEIESFIIQSNKKLYINNRLKFELVYETLTHYGPVMVTDDGVEIFEGDPYWFIWLERPCRYHIINKPYYIKHASGDTGGWCDNVKFFSTKEKANEYIFKHTPIYTTEDGVKIYPNDTVYYVLSNFSKKYYKPTKDDRNLFEIHYFSNEEAADEYINYNKPMYSLNDVLQFREIKYNYPVNDVIAILTQKLKL